MQFTSDWVSSRVPLWIPYVSHLVGKEAHALEIGSFEGRCTLWMLDNILTHRRSTITCVDPWSGTFAPHYRTFASNIAAHPRAESVIVHRCCSSMLDTLNLRQFHLIYVDGSHKGRHVLEDSVRSWRYLRTGGILVWDDYRWSADWKDPRERNPAPAVDAFLDLYGIELEVLHRDWQVIVRRTS